MRLVSLTATALIAMLAWSCSSPEPAPAPKGAQPEASAAGEPAELAAPTEPENRVRWKPLHIADGCDLRMAENPAAFDLRLGWKPCADGPPGCREISTNLGDDLFSGSRHLRGAMHGGEVTVVASLSLPGPILQHAIAPLDGAPFLVVEQPPEAGCSIGVGGASDDGAVVEVAYDNEGGFASRAYLRGPLRQDPGWSKVVARLMRSEFPRFIGEAELSVGGHVVVAANGGPLRWLDPATEKWVGIPGSKSGWACCFAAHGDFATFMIESIPERVMAARLGEPARELRPPVKGGGTSPIAIDGNRAVWAEGRGRDKNNYYQSIELLSGQITPQLAIEHARVVTALPLDGMPRPVFNGGMAVVSLYRRGEADRLAVIRVADGEIRLLAAPDGLRNERLLWVTGDEIAVMVGPGGNHLGPSTIRRIPIGALPRMPPGGGEEAR